VIFILDAVLRLCILHKLEPPSNNLRILAQGSLVVVLAIELDSKLRLALNKCTRPVYANLAHTMLSTQRVGHISHSSKPRRKSSRIKVKYMLNNHLLLCLE
jgi:hypothetical protein